MRSVFGSFTLLDAPMILRDQLGKQGDFVLIVGNDPVEVQFISEYGTKGGQLVNPGDKLILPLDDLVQITISSPSDTYPLTVQWAINTEGIGYDSPHQGNADLVAQIEAAKAFQVADLYESTEMILAASSSQSSAKSYALVNSLQVAVTTAPTSAGVLTIADAGGAVLSTIALITGLLNFMVPLPRPVLLKTAGFLQIESTVVVTLSVSITGN